MEDWISNVLFLLVLFVANTVQTITGFAGNMLAMPPSILLIGVDLAKTILNVFTLIACVYIWWKNREHVNKKILGKMVVFMVIGMYLGIWIYNIVPTSFLLKGYAVLIIIIACYKMFVKREIHVPQFFMIFVILAAGMIHGMFVSGGALLVVYAVSVLKNKDEFRATVAPVWVILDFILMFSHAKSGFYTSSTIWLIGISILPLVGSIWLGNRLYTKINQKTFLKITYILLLVSGLLLL